MPDWERRIEELGIELMDPLPAGGLYTPLVIVGDLGFTAGTVAVEGPPLKLAYAGCLGDDIDVETGKLSARQAFISTLSNLRGALGTPRPHRTLRQADWATCARRRSSRRRRR